MRSQAFSMPVSSRRGVKLKDEPSGRLYTRRRASVVQTASRQLPPGARPMGDLLMSQTHVAPLRADSGFKTAFYGGFSFNKRARGLRASPALAQW